MKATPVYLRCPKRVKRKPCGKPLTKGLESKTGIVEMVCPDGHTTSYHAVYINRFIFPSLTTALAPIPPPACPNCHLRLAASGCTVMGTIVCGGCGITLSWNTERQEWEVVEVGQGE